MVRAVDAATDLLLEGGWRNVLVEINNECNTRYEHAMQPPRVHELIERVQRRSGVQAYFDVLAEDGVLPR